MPPQSKSLSYASALVFCAEAYRLTGCLQQPLQYLHAHVAPTGSPERFTVTQHRARNITFSWFPPALTLRNGVITGYSLSCVPETGVGNTISMQYTAAGTFTLGGFTPATSYNCSISASNSQGSGPAAHVDVTTLDDGENTMLLGY